MIPRREKSAHPAIILTFQFLDDRKFLPGNFNRFDKHLNSGIQAEKSERERDLDASRSITTINPREWRFTASLLHGPMLIISALWPSLFHILGVKSYRISNGNRIGIRCERESAPWPLNNSRFTADARARARLEQYNQDLHSSPLPGAQKSTRVRTSHLNAKCQ